MVKTTRRVVNVIAKYYEKIHVQTLLRLIEFATFGLAALLARPLLVYIEPYKNSSVLCSMVKTDTKTTISEYAIKDCIQ